MDTTLRNVVQHKYGRDYLLQLRLHPFSLQKPNNLKNYDIVKEKLYLHQLNFGTDSHKTSLTCYPDFKLPLKDPENVLSYHSMPDYFTRNCSSYIERKSNSGIHVKPSSKSRQLYIPDYVNPIQKMHFQNGTDYEDLLNDGVYCSNGPWLKQFSEETWNRSNWQSNQESSSKLKFEISSKSKKKPLPIIDPSNGKNILDGICEISTSQENICEENNEHFEPKSDSVILTELNKQSDHDGCTLLETNYNNKTENVDQNIFVAETSSPSHISDSSNQNLSFKESTKFCKDHESTLATFEEEKHDRKYDFDMNLKKATESIVDNDTPIKEMYDSDYGIYKKFTSSSYDGIRIAGSFESLEGNSVKDIHGDLFNEKKHTSDRNKIIAGQESYLNLVDQLKMNIKLLREKLYSIRQQQQKMAILQSFLSFKKHQLDESYRKLDDKKIEIANWEYDLANRAKKLQEKECRLDAKRLSLLDKESKLDQREKILNGNQKYIETEFQLGDITSENEGENFESKTNESEKIISMNYELGDSSEIKFQ